MGIGNQNTGAQPNPDPIGRVVQQNEQKALDEVSVPSENDSEHMSSQGLSKRKGSASDDRELKRLKADPATQVAAKGEAKHESVDATPRQTSSDSDIKGDRLPTAQLVVQILEQAEQFVETDDDYVFNKTKIVIPLGDSVFIATTDKMIGPKLSVLDIGADDLVRIPPEHFCPEFKDGLTRASMPLLEGIYIKKSRLASWEPEDHDDIASLVLQEAEICEILMKTPHPNVAQYHGCLVENGRITGLCFTKYTSDLTKMLTRKGITKAERLALSEAIENGIRHLHRLGLAHNDINPCNIMMEGDIPVIIDFDSARPIGEKLGSKVGTPDWELDGAEISETKNDMFSLEKVKELILQVKLQRD